MITGVRSVTDDGAIARVDRLPPWASFALIRLGFWLLTAFTVLWYPEHGPGVAAFTAWGKLPSVVFGTFEQLGRQCFFGFGAELGEVVDTLDQIATSARKAIERLLVGIARFVEMLADIL